MKKNCILSVMLLFGLQTFAQLYIGTGAQWVNTGNVVITINNMDLVNNGNFVPANSGVRFSGSSDNSISGSSTTTFYDLVLAKGVNNKLILVTDANIDHDLNFISGLLDLNQKNLTLASTAV